MACASARGKLAAGTISQQEFDTLTRTQELYFKRLSHGSVPSAGKGEGGTLSREGGGAGGAAARPSLSLGGLRRHATHLVAGAQAPDGSVNPDGMQALTHSRRQVTVCYSEVRVSLTHSRRQAEAAAAHEAALAEREREEAERGRIRADR